MSYDLYFLKTDTDDVDAVNEILEAEDANSSDSFYISKELIKQVESSLKRRQLRFECFENPQNQSVELNFPTFQVSLFNTQIVLSIPYCDSNEEISFELISVYRAMEENGLRAFDPQTEEFITDINMVQHSVSETKTAVYKILNEETKQPGRWLLYLGILIVLLVLSLIFRSIFA